MYATQTAVTTLTCIADYMSWTTVSRDVKLQLGLLYAPYLALGMWLLSTVKELVRIRTNANDPNSCVHGI